MPSPLQSLHALAARAQPALALLEEQDPLVVLQAHLLAMKPPAFPCGSSFPPCVNALANLTFRLLSPFQLTPHLHHSCARLHDLATRRLTDPADPRALRRHRKPYPDLFAHLARSVDQIQTHLLAIHPHSRQPDIPTAAKVLVLLADALNDLALLEHHLLHC